MRDQIIRNLDHYMKEADMSKSELARKIGVTKQTVSNWFAGKCVPKMNKVDAICQVFGISREQLIGIPVRDRDSEIVQLFNALDESNRTKLLELGRLYLNAQHSTRDKE